MDLVIFGLNHRTAPLPLREKWAFTAEEARQALQGAQDLVSASENLILSTCNRTEIYSVLPGSSPPAGVGPTPSSACAKNLDDLLDFYHHLKNFRREREGTHYYTIREREAVAHLFRLAAGLDSMIVGEGQILRQLRDAFELARQAGSLGKVFLRLFPAAMRAGRRTRSETGIGRGCITHGQAALQAARQVFPELRGRSVLLIGAGKVTKLVAKALAELGAGRLWVVSRSLAGAQEIAAELGGAAFPIEELPSLLETADLAISSTGAVSPVVTRAMVERAAARRAGRPLCFIDLAVPRDVEPACGDVPGVVLRNIDDLTAVIQGNIQERLTEVPRAEGIVREELTAFLSQMNWIHLDPVIRHLVERFEAIRVAEVGRHLHKLPAEHRAAVEELTSDLVKKLLHFPIATLKSLRDDAGLTPSEIGFLRRLFLRDAPGPAPSPGPTHDEPTSGRPPSHPHREPG